MGIIDGKSIAADIRSRLVGRVRRLKEQGVVPGLAVVLVGDDPASHLYVSLKERACANTGIRSEKHILPTTVAQSELEALVEQLGSRQDVHAILVQLPLPKGLDPFSVMLKVPPGKDVDGFHPLNVGRLSSGQGGGFIPCTPLGIMEIIKCIQVELNGARAVVIGRSNIVGRPVATLLLQADATVTLCHSRTKNLADECRSADILVVAAGKPGLVKGNWVKPGAVVIDVGINKLSNGHLVGDVAFDEVAKVAGFITPVPGGVGPMTIAMLLSNTVLAAEEEIGH